MSIFKKIESGETTVHDSKALKIILAMVFIGAFLLGLGLAGFIW